MYVAPSHWSPATSRVAHHYLRAMLPIRVKSTLWGNPKILSRLSNAEISAVTRVWSRPLDTPSGTLLDMRHHTENGPADGDVHRTVRGDSNDVDDGDLPGRPSTPGDGVEELSGVGAARMAEYVVHAAMFHDVAAFEDGDVVGQTCDDGKIVRNEHVGDTQRFL